MKRSARYRAKHTGRYWRRRAPPRASGCAPDLRAAQHDRLAAAVIAIGLIIWRDHAAGPAWQTMTAGLLFAVMIALSGHDNLLIGVAVLVLAMMLVLAITGHLRRPHAGPVPPRQPGTLKVS